MEYVSGLLAALAVTGLPALTGIGRGRDFYPIALIVIAFYYVLFAAMGGSRQAVLFECAVAGGFVLLAIVAFRTKPWVAAVAIAGHGLFDLVHHMFIDNAGVPLWWPGFCATADVAIGAIVVLHLAARHRIDPAQEVA